MLQILYLYQSGVCVSGTLHELQTTRRAIIDLAEGDHCSVALAANPIVDLTHNKSVIQKLLLMKGDGSTKVSLLNEKTIKVEGLPDNLMRLASFFDFKPDAAAGTHCHYEFFEGNQWIAPDSIPLVVTVKV